MDIEMMDESFQKMYSELGDLSQKGSLLKLRSLMPDFRLKSDNIEQDLNHFIFLSSFQGHAHIVRYLLSEGVNVNPATPIRFATHAKDATETRYIDCIRAFVEYGWDINSDDRTYGNALK